MSIHDSWISDSNFQGGGVQRHRKRFCSAPSKSTLNHYMSFEYSFLYSFVLSFSVFNKSHKPKKNQVQTMVLSSTLLQQMSAPQKNSWPSISPMAERTSWGLVVPWKKPLSDPGFWRASGSRRSSFLGNSWGFLDVGWNEKWCIYWWCDISSTKSFSSHGHSDPSLIGAATFADGSIGWSCKSLWGHGDSDALGVQLGKVMQSTFCSLWRGEVGITLQGTNIMN